MGRGRAESRTARRIGDGGDAQKGQRCDWRARQRTHSAPAKLIPSHPRPISAAQNVEMCGPAVLCGRPQLGPGRPGDAILAFNRSLGRQAAKPATILALRKTAVPVGGTRKRLCFVGPAKTRL